MSNILKKIIGSVILLVIGAGLLYSFLLIKTWHAKAVYLDCALAANGNQTALTACSQK